MARTPPASPDAKVRLVWAAFTEAEDSKPLLRRSVVFDLGLAAVVTAGSLAAVRFTPSEILAAVVTSAPLATRRRFPLVSFLVLALCVVITRTATGVTVLAVVVAAYSAVVYTRFRAAAILSLPGAGLVMTVALWNTTEARTGTSGSRIFEFPSLPGLRGLVFGPQFPLRPAVLVVLASVVSIAFVGYSIRARERMRRLTAEHEASTVRALELERARLASELHDVVTHSVSVMIVQAGAARKVLGDIPDDARDALLAVEATGRAAMTELRHLLGLLSPAPPAADDPPDWRRGGDDLQPQPGLEQVHSLVAGVWATGLPVQLFAEAMPPDVPAGVSLTAFRIVQEGLTNVMKHAGTPSTKVTVSCLDKSVLVEVADDGDPAAGGTTATPTIGRGLFGLHERVALYGGELDYGPRPGGGWSLRARIPTRRLAAPARDDRPSPGRPAPRG